MLWRSWLGGRKGIRPVKTEWWDAGVVVCLEQGADNSMIYMNSITYTLFLIPDYQLRKVFFVSLGNNFFTVFVETP